MKQTIIVDINKQEVTIKEGMKLISCSPAKIEMFEFNSIRVDHNWYTITETLDEGVHVVQTLFELDVLDDYITTKQCEELSEGDM